MLFTGLNQEAIQNFILWSQARTKTYGPGEYIFQVGDRANFAYILLKGAVEVENLSPQGNRTLVTTFTEPYSIFGEVYALLDQAFEYNAQAIEESLLLQIPRKALLDCLENEAQAPVGKNLVLLLAHKAHSLNQRLQIQSSKSLEEKILRDLVRREKDGVIVMKESRETWAQFLGIPRPSLSRKLSRMQKEGLITIKGRKIILNI